MLIRNILIIIFNHLVREIDFFKREEMDKLFISKILTDLSDN